MLKGFGSNTVHNSKINFFLRQQEKRKRGENRREYKAGLGRKHTFEVKVTTLGR